MSVHEAISGWSIRVAAYSDTLAPLDTIFGVKVEGSGGGSWLVRCREPVSILEGEGEADCAITVHESDFLRILEGDLNPQSAYLAGKIRIEGNFLEALKIARVFEVFRRER